jgi:NAD(P)-dependent dehydrogenase (short-subunit alcohol dehydrogenase family)
MNNRTIVVAGAGSGIGRVIVRGFAEQGILYSPSTSVMLV